MRTLKNRKAQPIGGVIDRVVRSLGLATRYGGWLAVNQWPEIVGQQIAQAARAVRFRDGTLYVAVPSAAWRQELSLQREVILQKIRSRPYGKAVTEIRLIHGERG